MVIRRIEPIFEPVFLHAAKLSFDNLKKVLIFRQEANSSRNLKVKSKK
jgi:hypothetical protein